MSLSGISKFILGFLLAIALIALAGVGTTRYFLAQLATPPARPTFANDPSPSPPADAPSSPPTASVPSPQPSVTPSPSPTLASSPGTQGYAARVTQPIGLILRQDPSGEAGRIGGIEFNQEVTVLEDSPDGAWQRVRLTNGTEGWVKGGNIERSN
ncbi:MAG: SH3 domain-containing protein [Leptolyngbyaceae cyanobacterium CRU_2_3]|nr:SH3 domain-containing protein [Leptolyngbyaceae cyanobacterium CRU_2_3]